VTVTYLPAYWPSVLVGNRWTRRPLDAMDPRLRGTDAYHPYALASYGAPNWRGAAWEPEDFVFGDSGGYSMATRDVEINPTDVIRWQIKRCEVGAVLDQPPWQDWSQRQACLRRTVANVKAAVPIYRRALETGTPFRWWGVVHGRTTVELERWWQAISRVYPFTDDGEGWAFRPHPLNDPEAIMRVLAFVKAQGIRRAHFFATSGFNAVETLYALAGDVGLVSATFDSTTPLMRGFRYMLVIPTASGYETVNERFRDTRGADTRARDYMRRECPCHSCALLRDDLRENGTLRTDEGYWYSRFMFHNVLATLTCFEALHRRYAHGQGHAPNLNRVSRRGATSSSPPALPQRTSSSVGAC